MNMTIAPMSIKFKDLLEECSRLLAPNDFIELATYVSSVGLQATLQVAKKVSLDKSMSNSSVYGNYMTAYHNNLERSLTSAASSVVKDLYVKIDFLAPAVVPIKPKPKLSLVKNDVDAPPKKV